MGDIYLSSKELLDKAQILYDFVDLFSNYENNVRDYGNNSYFSMTEVHLLAAIYSHPGITSTELASLTRRSKSFISQIINKMETGGYIIKISEKEDSKRKQLFVSQKGIALCIAHNEFDEKQLVKTYNYLLRDCSAEEISAFYKVMSVYNIIMEAAKKKRETNN